MSRVIPSLRETMNRVIPSLRGAIRATKQSPTLILILLCLILPACTATTLKPTEKVSPKKSETTDSTQVMMLGRSVMGGWFSHWIGDTSQPYDKDGFHLYYREIEGPDGIMDSVESKVEEDSGNASIIFFKLCFVDFNGDDRDSARDNLERNKGYVEQAYEVIVSGTGKKMIVGNALPQTASSTTDDLVWNHREYNEWLNEFAASHPGKVWIFDQYDILTDANGSLRNGYETSNDDSHPNDSAYTALDEPLFNLLKSIP